MLSCFSLDKFLFFCFKIVENDITFLEGLNMGEDLYFNLQLYLHAKKIVSMDWAPYHYRHTDSSSCVQRTRNSIDSDIAIAGKIEEFMRERNQFAKYAKDIEYRKFFSKLPLINDLNDGKLYKEWLSIYPETNKNIWQYDQIDWKHKIELWLAAKGLLSLARTFHFVLKIQHQNSHYGLQLQCF